MLAFGVRVISTRRYRIGNKSNTFMMSVEAATSIENLARFLRVACDT